ncbi:MAG: ribonuclease HII [Bacillota bacterium]|nr:ribonuclease HII [Bacillota bacterium]
MKISRTNHISLWTIDQISAYLHKEEEVTVDQISILQNDRRKGVQKLLSSYLQQREKARQEEKHLHNLRMKEKSLHMKGYTLIAGVDEAGRGPLAGPVVAAAVILNPQKDRIWQGINDSKQLTSQIRDRLYQTILENAEAYGIGIVTAALIDEINIYQASLEAMRLAVEELMPKPDFVLSDGFPIPGLGVPQEAVKHGDALCLSIAAASIIAKVYRDRIMLTYDQVYPVYGFAKHKGYPTLEHREAIKKAGLSPIHRRSFKCQ